MASGTFGASLLGLCTANAYADALGRLSCTPCPQHAVAPSGSTAVTSCECEAGFFGPHEGPAEDTYKAAVGAGDGNTCLPCPPGSSTHQRLGQTRCFCDAGFEEDDATLANTAAQCVACTPGTFNTAQPAGDAFLRTCVACGTCGDSSSSSCVYYSHMYCKWWTLGAPGRATGI